MSGTPRPAGARATPPRYLEVEYRGKSIAGMLGLMVDAAWGIFADAPHALRNIGLGQLRRGQPATKPPGGEAQQVKLATELGRSERGTSLYMLGEPTTGLHTATEAAKSRTARKNMNVLRSQRHARQTEVASARRPDTPRSM
jgi:excinuclease UvrABC ATPase subunit